MMSRRDRAGDRPEETAPLPGADERVVQRLRELDVAAPAALRARVARMSAEAVPARHRSGPSVALVLSAVAVVAVAAVLVLTGSGGPGGGGTVGLNSGVARLTRIALAAAADPPAATPEPDRLDAHVGTVAFPHWGRSVGWTPAGVRRERLLGRRVLTVDYRSPQGAVIGYAIAPGPPLARVPGVSETHLGVRFTVIHPAGGVAVTWRRQDDTCVLAGRDVSAHRLMVLASTQY